MDQLYFMSVSVSEHICPYPWLPFLEEVVPEETSKAETPQADNPPPSAEGLVQEEAKVTGLWAVSRHWNTASQPEARDVARLREFVFAERQQLPKHSF